jgi:hypothetical protein
MKLVVKTTLLTTLAVLPLIAGCSKKSDNNKPAAAPAASEQTPATPPAAAGSSAPTAPAAPATPPSADTSADLPSECTEYAALIDKLKTCDKLGAARAALTQAYENLHTAWGTTPPDRRGEITAQCKTQAESLRNAVAATCGW